MTRNNPSIKNLKMILKNCHNLFERFKSCIKKTAVWSCLTLCTLLIGKKIASEISKQLSKIVLRDQKWVQTKQNKTKHKITLMKTNLKTNKETGLVQLNYHYLNIDLTWWRGMERARRRCSSPLRSCRSRRPGKIKIFS